VLLEPVSIYKKSENESHKTITLRVTIMSYERTLTTAEVSSLLDSLAKEAHSELGVDRA
jgi:phenylalanyl-tRNA synthetase beta subunit